MLSSRDGERTRSALAAWIAARNPDARSVEITDLSCPRSGFSGELLICDARWTDGGERVEQGMVLRVEPSGHQVFLDTRFEEQYRVQEILSSRTDLPVPRTLGFEADTSVLGSRFYATERVSGRCVDPAQDIWWTELDEAVLEKMWSGGLEYMARIHRLDWAELGLGFLAEPGRGDSPLDQQLNYYREYYTWSVEGSDRQPALERTLDWLEDNRPATEPEPVLVWGDARHGNLLYDEAGGVSAVLDWEMAALGAPELDVSWCLALDRMSRAHPALAKFPAMDPSLSAYERLLGRPLQDIEYYAVFSLLRSAVIVNRLEMLTRLAGGAWPYPNGSLLMLAATVGAPPASTGALA